MALDEDSYEWASAVPRWQQQALARLAATQVLSQALRGPPRGVALEARGRECFEQAGSGLDAVASVDAAAFAYLLRDGELEPLVDAELGADVVEAFKELLALGTSQNPSVEGAAHRGATARDGAPSRAPQPHARQTAMGEA